MNTLTEAFEELNRLNENVDDNAPDWAKRIYKCIEAGTLDPETLEEFIKEHEIKYSESSDELPETIDGWPLKDVIKQEMIDGWCRTEVFDYFQLSPKQLVKELSLKGHNLGIEYYVISDYSEVILIQNDAGLYDWFKQFEDPQDIADFLNDSETNLLPDYSEVGEIEDFLDNYKKR